MQAARPLVCFKRSGKGASRRYAVVWWECCDEVGVVVSGSGEGWLALALADLVTLRPTTFASTSHPLKLMKEYELFRYLAESTLYPLTFIASVDIAPVHGEINVPEHLAPLHRAAKQPMGLREARLGNCGDCDEVELDVFEGVAPTNPAREGLLHAPATALLALLAGLSRRGYTLLQTASATLPLLAALAPREARDALVRLSAASVAYAYTLYPLKAGSASAVDELLRHALASPPRLQAGRPTSWRDFDELKRAILRHLGRIDSGNVDSVGQLAEMYRHLESLTRHAIAEVFPENRVGLEVIFGRQRMLLETLSGEPARGGDYDNIVVIATEQWGPPLHLALLYMLGGDPKSRLYVLTTQAVLHNVRLAMLTEPLYPQGLRASGRTLYVPVSSTDTALTRLAARRLVEKLAGTKTLFLLQGSASIALAVYDEARRRFGRESILLL